MEWKLSSGKPFTRPELMEDAQWLLLLVGALQIQVALIIAILAREFTVEAMVFAAIGLIFILLALLRVYWARFIAMLIWTGALSADFMMRRNIISIFFILVGVLLLYRMIRFRNCNG